MSIRTTQVTQMIDNRALLDPDQAAEFLNISRTTLTRLTERRQLRRIKIGSLTRYAVNDLSAFINSDR